MLRGEHFPLERLERALAFVAALIVRDGDQYAPVLDRLERELEAARRNSATARAKRILEEFREKAATAEPIRLTSDPPRQLTEGNQQSTIIPCDL